jgi:hypothetical protein
MASKMLTVVIEANGRYCNNDCRFMTADAKSCRLFDVALQWNTKRKYNGNMRPSECRKLEVMSP